MSLAAAEQEAPIGAWFDPLDAAYLEDPYPYLTEARRAAPVFFADSIDHWVVTRHRDIKQIFRDPPTFSAVNANAPLRPPCPMAAKALEDGNWRAVPTLANVDPPAHTRVRRIANIAFTPKRVADMESFVRELTVRFCKERLRDGHADLVADLAWELPVLVLFRILGVDDREVPRVKEGSWNRILFIYGRPSESEQVKAAHGMARFWSIAESLVEARAREPRDDFVSTLVHTADAEGKTLTREQAATVVLNLLFAGHETTTGLLGNMFNRLLADRQAWSDIVADRSLIPNAVEEILRFDSSVIAWRRRTTRATDVGGVRVPQGANLLMMLGAANRDPDVFADPDRLDIRRANAREHLSFGNGAHLCLGAPLARLQARVVMEEVSSRLPSLRLAADAKPTFAPNVSFRGPLSLGVVWDA
ncbi:MAG: cytochrome P450 [Methylobacteriaceae bacterium]|nr:cytochrome P450 [Methylobacteriaceae bacterium]